MQLNNSISFNFYKRVFDIFFSGVGLILFAPVIIFTWLIATIETKSNGFFIQERVGRFGNIFLLIKIKTMIPYSGITTNVTSSRDIRITRSGAFFRKTKIDELPQLWNILVGHMSFVGPRPDVKGYADQLQGDDRIVLSIRPGITGPASLKYKHEEEILSSATNPELYNDTIIWPDKVKINIDYVLNYTFRKDIEYIIKTIKG